MTSSELADVSGLTLRQIQWWTEHRILHPQQSGHRREFDLSEAAICCIGAQLRMKGWPLRDVTKIIRRLRGKTIRSGYLVILIGKSSPYGVLTNDAEEALWLLDETLSNKCSVIDLEICLEGLRVFRWVEENRVA
jgi:DNA-binding transcriptional MerR regulator